MRGETISVHGYRFLRDPRKNDKRGLEKYTREHVMVAERALGRELPIGAVVHHIDEVKLNNSNSNLVICQDESYHQELHRRTKAFYECGNADWCRCIHCGVYDEPSKMGKTTLKGGRYKRFYHLECHNRNRALYYKVRK